MPAREGVDDDHRGATIRADECWLNGLCRRISALGVGVGVGYYVEQFTCLGEVVFALGIGDQSIVTDAMKPAGQHMQ